MPPTNCIDITVPLNEAQIAVEAVTGAAFTGTTQALCAAYIANLGSDYTTLVAKHGRYVVMSCVAVER